MPVPGDGSFEWNGFFAKDMLPSSYNPKEGFFATANEYNLPAGYPAEERKVAFEWTDPPASPASRKCSPRIQESASPRTPMALQTDSTSPQSRKAIALLKNVSSSDPAVSKALDLLRKWDSNLKTDSVAASIYEVWANKHLGRAVVARATPLAAREIVGNGHLEAVLTYLAKPDTRLGPIPKLPATR